MALRLSTSSSNLSRTFKAVGCALLGILLVELAAGAMFPESLMIHYFKLVRDRITREEGVTVQVMGDSVARTALWAHRLEQAHEGHRFENYALGGSGPVFSYFLLRDQVEAGNAPKAVLYAHSPHTYSGVRFPVLVGSFCTWGEVFEILATGYKPSDVAFGVLNRLFYTLRYRDQIKDALTGDPSFFVSAREPVFGEQLYQVERENFTRHDFSQPLGRTYTDPFAVSELNRHYLDKFLALAGQHDIAVFWVTLPLSQKVLEARINSGFVDDYYAFVDSLAGRGVTILQKEFVVLANEHFSDYSHVNVEGGDRFSDLVAEKLRAVISPPSPDQLTGVAGRTGAAAP